MTSTAELTELVQTKIKDLPPLPLVVQKLVQTLDDDKSSAEDVMKVLSSDQALASKVLKLVNSSFYGLSGEISTPSRAVVILGFAAIRNLAVGLSVAKFMSLGGNSERLSRFWDHSITVAAACQVLAKQTGYPDAEEAFIAGLLHDIGQVVLGIALPQEYRKLLDGDPRELLAAEESTIGIGHAKAGQMLLKHWRLPRNLTSAIRYHHNAKIFCGDKDPLVSLVALADSIANVHGVDHERPLPPAEFTALLQVTGFPVEATGELLATLTTRVEETRVFLQIATDEVVPAASLDVALPGTVSVISTNPAHMAWTTEVLSFFGVGQMAMKDFFAGSATDDEPAGIILDLASVSAEQLQKMQPRLAATPAIVFALGGDPSGQAPRVLGRELRDLPLAFSRGDLSLAT